MKYLFLLVVVFVTNGVSAQNLTLVNYGADETNFPNPGRGFYHADDQLEPGTIANYPAEGITLVLREYHIDEFRDAKIPVWYLWNIKRDLNNLRNAGLKVILRFRYTSRTTKPYNDAPLNIVLMHIKQLEPILRENSDVIFTFQAGFIGAWGEWYYTDYFSESPGNITEQNWIDRRTVVDSLLSMLPPDIMVNVRTPDYKRHLLNEESYNPVTEEEAYTDLPVARISHHNDCFLASCSDVGTYTDTAVQKPYLAEDTKYTVIGGETCGQSSFSHCENALKELKRFHWSYLNRDYHQGVIGDWIDEGCYPTIEKNLGYRFRLINGEYSTNSNPQGEVIVKLNILNEGYANPVNPMDVNIILRNVSTGKEYTVKVKDDLRFWPIDDTVKLDLNFGLPEQIEEGTYDLFLAITDAHITLKENPSYSVRFANDNVWESETGYNYLQHQINISGSGASSYNGGDFFVEKNKQLSHDNNIIVDGNDEDWNIYPVVYHIANQNAQTLKVWNSSDSLYFMIAGENQGEDTEYYIDADNNDSSGYQSFDYKLTSSRLYYFDNEQWIEIQNVIPNYSGNAAVKEIGMAMSDFTQKTIGQTYGLKVKSGSDYLPLAGQSAVKVHRNLINNIPFIKVVNKGNTNTIYWNRNVENNQGYVALSRYLAGNTKNPANTIAVLPNNVISYQDKEVESGVEYFYTVSYLADNVYMPCVQEQNVTVESDIQEYININLDGQSDDWKLCKPVATGIVNNQLAAVRFYNTSDMLFYSIDMGDSINEYQLLFNVDGLPGMDFKISNDSLFRYENENWNFIKIIDTFLGKTFLESNIMLSEIDFDSIDYLTAKVYINGTDLWGNDQAFSFLKYPVLNPPDNFDLKVSLEKPYTRIKVKWLFSTNPDAYVIERSIDDSLHFETLTEVSNTTSYYLDDDVDSSHVYYYRMFSHKDVLRSSYTETKWMRPGVAGINSIEQNTGSVNIFPLPVSVFATINVKLTSPDNVRMELLSLTGKSLQTLYHGRIVGEKNIGFNASKLPAGFYFLKIKGDNTLMIKKIVKK